MKAWNTYQLQTLKSTYNCMSNADIAKLIGKSKRAVILAKLKLNLVRYHVVNYTADEEIFLKQNYQNTPTKMLAALLKRTPGAINLKLKQMGLHRTAQQIKCIRKQSIPVNSISIFSSKDLSHSMVSNRG